MAIKTVPSATPLGVREPVLIVFLVVAIVANFALQLLNEKLGHLDWLDVIFAGSFIGRGLVAIMLAGLIGRSWLGAYGIVLGGVGLCLCASKLLDWWQSGFSYRDLADPCAVPLLLLIAAVPCMALRQLAGLRMAVVSSVPWSRRTLRIGDIFVAVAFTAAMLVFARVGTLWSYGDRTDLLSAAGMISLIGFGMGVLFVVPAVWCVFVAKSRRSMLLGLGGLLLLPSLICVVVLAFISSESMTIEEKQQGLAVLAVVSVTAAVYYFPLLLLLHMRGYRLLRVPVAAPDDPPARYQHASRWIVATIVAAAVVVNFYISPLEESRQREQQFKQWVSSLGGQAKQEGDLTWTLDFSAGHVNDDDLKYLRSAPSIVGLVLSGTNVTDAGLEFVGTLNTLKLLELNDTAVTDRGMRHLRQLPSLQTLSLQHTGVTGDVFAEFESRDTIVKLDLNGAAVTDEGCEGIGKLKALQELNLNGTAFTDSGLRHLGDLTRLQILLLQSTKFQGDGFASFSDIPQLAVVQLSDSHCGDGVTHLVSHAPALYELSLDRTAATDAVMSVLQGHATIAELELSGTAITDDGLSQLRSLPNLQTLGLNGTSVNGSGFRNLSARRLEVLRLKGTRVSDESLAFLKRFPRLQSIFLNDTPVGDNGLSHLAGKWFSEVNVAGTQITAQGLLHAHFDAYELTVDDQQGDDAELAAVDETYETVVVVPKSNALESEQEMSASE